VRWAYNPARPWKGVAEAPNVPIDQARERIEKKGRSLHKAGEAGYR
jgi:trehalose utilization protein